MNLTIMKELINAKVTKSDFQIIIETLYIFFNSRPIFVSPVLFLFIPVSVDLQTLIHTKCNDFLGIPSTVEEIQNYT